ncbi:MAG: SDR family oxidoreductase [Actinomycetota bacterium]|nr:SDR family oxidoreductase [Actinomycetota bacterium]
MQTESGVVVIGGTSGLGREIAKFYADRGEEVILSGRELHRAEIVAKEIGGRTTGVALDLTRPQEIADALRDANRVQHLVLSAVDRDQNTARDYDLSAAVRLVTLKLVGYTEVIHALAPRLQRDASILLFGGGAKDRPYPGSTTITTINAAISGMVRTLAVELAPIRVNAIHPGIVGDSPYWSAKPSSVLEGFRSRTPTGRLPTTADVVGASAFLLENPSANAIDLPLDGGWLLL